MTKERLVVVEKRREVGKDGERLEVNCWSQGLDTCQPPLQTLLPQNAANARD